MKLLNDTSLGSILNLDDGEVSDKVILLGYGNRFTPNITVQNYRQYLWQTRFKRIKSMLTTVLSKELYV